MTRSEFGQCMAALSSGIGRDISEQQVTVWFDCLKDLSFEYLAKAVKRYLQQVPSGFPNPAILREFATVAEHGELPTAGEAWTKIIKAVRLQGRYRSTEAMATLDELSRMAVNACGGFTALCDMTTDNRSILAGQFRRQYENFAERYETQRRLPDDVRPKAIKSIPAHLLPVFPSIDG